MQPYFLPYIGYWQLINAVDTYVVYDDVNYIKQGWINRNRILIQNKVHYFNIKLNGASSFKKINEITVNEDKRWRAKNISTLLMAYKKAPYFSVTYPLIEDILLYRESNLALYLLYTIKKICSYLNIQTNIVLSSSLNYDRSQSGQDKVLNICRKISADTYYNAIGGTSLYDKALFMKNCIDLKFLKPDQIVYRQFSELFYENLSILDVMMFNSPDEIRGMLSCYKLI